MALRALAQRMLDERLHVPSSLTHRPAWREIPADMRALFDEPVPPERMGADAAYARFCSHILPSSSGNWHHLSSIA